MIRCLFSLSICLFVFLSPVSAKNYWVYFGVDKARGIYVANFDTETGYLSRLRLAAEIERPGFIALHPNKQFVYSTAAGLGGSRNGRVAAFRVGDDGELYLINDVPSEGKNPCHVEVDATGRCLTVTNYGSGHVAAMRIYSDGALEKSNSIHEHVGMGLDKKRQTRAHPHSSYFNPANTHLYVPDLGMDKVVIYEVDLKRTLLIESEAVEVPGGGQGPRHMKFSKNGKRAYVLNELGLELSTYDVEASSGSLVHRSQVAVLFDHDNDDNISAAEIRVHPSGKFLYTSNRDKTGLRRDSISVFEIQQRGGIRLIDVVPAEVHFPRNFNIDPSGKWLLVAGQRSNDLTVFRIDEATGKIKYTGDRVRFDGGPMCVTFGAEIPE